MNGVGSFSSTSTARACARNMRFSVSPSSSSLAASLRVECDSIRMRSPCFCATLIHGSIRLTAATSPRRSASRRLTIVPALVVVTCSCARKPSIIFSVVKCEPLFGVTAIGRFLSISGANTSESRVVTMANFDIEAPSATLFAVRLDGALHDAPLAHPVLVDAALVVGGVERPVEDRIELHGVRGGHLRHARRGDELDVEPLVPETSPVAGAQHRQVVHRVHDGNLVFSLRGFLNRGHGALD